MKHYTIIVFHASDFVVHWEVLKDIVVIRNSKGLPKWQPFTISNYCESF
jgi:hypothetical protein